MLLKELRTQVLEANLELVKRGLVLYTFGNASGIDREKGLVVIKPSGVDYDELPSIGGVVHPHSEFATSFAQAGLPIPPLGTTHADYFHGPVPCTEPLRDEAIVGRYVHETGVAIVDCLRLKGIDPLAIPACLVNGHAPFCWGRNPHEAAHNAVVLEAVARMAYNT